jgi:hypothetical protein
LRGGLHQHADFVFAKAARFDSLDDENTLENASIDQRDSEESFVGFFTGFPKIFKALVLLCVRERKRPQLFGDQAGESFAESHPESADTLWPEATRCGENETRAIGFEQINRADIGLESACDKGHYVAEGLRRLATVFGEISNFFERQDVLRVSRIYRLAQARLPRAFQVEDTNTANKIVQVWVKT